MRLLAPIWLLGLLLVLLLLMSSSGPAFAQGPVPTSTPRPIATPVPVSTPRWGVCAPTPPSWWGLQTPSPGWFAICGHCRQVWPTPPLRFWPSPTPHPWLSTVVPIGSPPPVGTPTPGVTPTPTPPVLSMGVITITDAPGFEGSLAVFGLPPDGVSYEVYPGWEIGGVFSLSDPDPSGSAVKSMIQVELSSPMTLTVGVGYYEFEDRYCAGMWGSSFWVGTEDFGGPGGQAFAHRGLVLCWDEGVYPPQVIRYYLDAKDDAFALAVSVERARIYGWWLIRVGGVDDPLGPTPTPALTPTPSPTPDWGPGLDCSDPNPGGEEEVIPIPRVGDRFCVGIGPVNFSMPLIGEVNIPEVRICFIPIWFGALNLFGIRINLDAVFFAMGAVLVIRWLLRS